MFLLSGIGDSRACCAECALGDASSPSEASPTQRSRWRLAALVVASAAAVTGAVYLATKKPPVRSEPRSARRRRRSYPTLELPAETMGEVVWERRR